jgi:hypothetical protein
VTKAWVDSGFKDDVAIRGAVHGIEQPRQPTGDTGTKAPEAHLIYETGISTLIAL